MKKINAILSSFLIAAGFCSCSMFGLDVQKDYEYKKSALDPHLNMSARQYLESRGKNPVIANDTIFKWMQLGLEYAGINLDEFEKPGRTFVFLSNGAIRVLPTRVVNGQTVPSSIVPTGGMWFTFPITQRNADGSIKLSSAGLVDTKPATKWEEYSKADVRKYFLYLIAEGDFGFNNAKTENTGLRTMLAPGMGASDSSRLGFYVVGTVQELNSTGNRVTTFVNAREPGLKYGFDQEGVLNFRILNSDYSPLQVNDLNTLTTSGLIATNGQIHVYAPSGTTPVPVFPYRY